MVVALVLLIITLTWIIGSRSTWMSGSPEDLVEMLPIPTKTALSGHLQGSATFSSWLNQPPYSSSICHFSTLCWSQ